MLYIKNLLVTLIILIVTSNLPVSAESIEEPIAAEYTKTTGTIWGFPKERVFFEVSDIDIAEVLKSRNGEFRVRFKRPGDVYVRATFYDVGREIDTRVYLFHIIGEATDEIAVNRNTFAHEVLDIVNQERAKAGLKPLKLAADLNEYANIRAKECIQKFSHTRPNGQDGVLIVPKETYKFVGENLSGGSTSAKAVMEQWMNSPTHRDNILFADYDELGVGYVFDENSRYRHYWVQLFRLKR